MMEEVPVVIVGAGPSGLTMGLSLAKYKVKVRSSTCNTEDGTRELTMSTVDNFRKAARDY